MTFNRPEFLSVNAIVIRPLISLILISCHCLLYLIWKSSITNLLSALLSFKLPTRTSTLRREKKIPRKWSKYLRFALCGEIHYSVQLLQKQRIIIGNIIFPKVIIRQILFTSFAKKWVQSAITANKLNIIFRISSEQKLFGKENDDTDD